MAIRIGSAPFTKSSIAVVTPAHIPAARITFVAPIRPLPTIRTSLPVMRFTISKPTGTAPITYPIIIRPKVSGVSILISSIIDL